MAFGTPNVGTVVEDTGAVTVSSVPFPSVTAGDLLVLWGSISANNSPASATTPSGWTMLFGNSTTSGTTQPSLYVFYKIASGSESGNESVTHVGSNSLWQIIGWSGLDGTTPIDVTGTSVDNSSNTNSTVTPSLTTTTAGVLLFQAAANSTGANTNTVNAGFTKLGERISGSRACVASYALQGSAGASGAKTVSWSGTAKNIGFMAAFRPGAGSSDFVKKWNGSAWVNVRQWNGSSWVAPKVWNGTRWVQGS